MASKKRPGLKRSNTPVEYTREQMLELLRCANDPAYFIKTYVYIKHAKRGKIKFDMYDYQEDMVRKYNSERFNIVLSARQTGKCVTSDTKITIAQPSNNIIKRALLYMLNRTLYNSLYKDNV